MPFRGEGSELQHFHKLILDLVVTRGSELGYGTDRR